MQDVCAQSTCSTLELQQRFHNCLTPFLCRRVTIVYRCFTGPGNFDSAEYDAKNETLITMMKLVRKFLQTLLEQQSKEIMSCFTPCLSTLKINQIEKSLKHPASLARWLPITTQLTHPTGGGDSPLCCCSNT